MNNDNKASQSKVASIVDDAQFLAALRKLLTAHNQMVSGPAGIDLIAAIDNFRASADQAASVAVEEAPIECWSADQEDFNATELDSVLTMHEHLKPGDTVWVGEAVRPEPGQLIDADDIMTMMGERAYDIAGEHAEDYPDVSKEAEQELNTLLAGWISTHARPSFWTVASIRPYVLSHDDFPNDPMPVQCDVPVALAVSASAADGSDNSDG